MSLSSAGDQMLGFANKFKDFIAAAEEVKRAGGLEKAVLELEGRKSAAESEIRDAVAVLGAAKVELEKANASIDKAAKDAEAVLAHADKRASEIVSEAGKKADTMLAERVAERNRVQAEIDAVRLDKAALVKEIASAKSELAIVDSKIASLKKQAAAVAGA